VNAALNRPVTIVRGGHVLSMGAAGDIADGRGRLPRRESGGGPFEEVAGRFSDAEVVGDGLGVVLPGLVNAHTHLSEGLLCGMGEDLTLLEWLARIVVPAGRHLTTGWPGSGPC
jgi:cytosine/adenosine deaminase-related metal-dependent hydrolase